MPCLEECTLSGMQTHNLLITSWEHKPVHHSAFKHTNGHKKLKYSLNTTWKPLTYLLRWSCYRYYKHVLVLGAAQSAFSLSLSVCDCVCVLFIPAGVWSTTWPSEWGHKQSAPGWFEAVLPEQTGSSQVSSYNAKMHWSFLCVYFSLFWSFQAALELKACLCPTFILVWAFKSYFQTSFWKVQNILHFSCYFTLDWKSFFFSFLFVLGAFNILIVFLLFEKFFYISPALWSWSESLISFSLYIWRTGRSGSMRNGCTS